MSQFLRIPLGVMIFSLFFVISGGLVHGEEAKFKLVTKQITFGPKHHFFGYIGHSRTIPWNKSGKYILSLRTDFQDHMPRGDEAAEIVLLDTANNYRAKPIDKSGAWNFQQGTMMYWNPAQPETQFFFNDRDPKTNKVFCVLFDSSRGKNGERIAEYRYDDTPIGNGGVSPVGGWFLGINYGRLANTRLVTGYPDAFDWTTKEKNNPINDGVFKVNIATKEKTLLVSFSQLADVLRKKYPKVDEQKLFINHTLWNPDESKFIFYARADFDSKDGKRIDALFSMNADGTQLKQMKHQLVGHLDWDSPSRLIGTSGKNQVIADIETEQVVETLGDETIFPFPKGDVAVSPDNKWFVNGHSDRDKNYYTVLRRGTKSWARTEAFNRGKYSGGTLRIDGAPAWNRESTQLIGYGLDAEKTRQMYLIKIESRQ